MHRDKTDPILVDSRSRKCPRGKLRVADLRDFDTLGQPDD